MTIMINDLYPLFPTFAFLGFVLALVPLPWHLHAWNSGCCIYVLWIALSCLIQHVNSVMWHGNTNDFASAWCDISTKLLLGAYIGVPAAAICISRRIYKIANMGKVANTRADKRNVILIDIGIALGIPIVVMSLHIIVQGYRFDILEGVGCTLVVTNTPLAYPLVLIWPPLLCSISFIYAGLALRTSWIRRVQFHNILSLQSSMTQHQYFRLAALAIIATTTTFSLSLLTIASTARFSPLVPYRSWTEFHADYARVERVSAEVWRADGGGVREAAVEFGRWVYPALALAFFGLFGLTQEARKNYRMVGKALAEMLRQHVRLPRWRRSHKRGPSDTLPIYIARPIPQVAEKKPPPIPPRSSLRKLQLTPLTALPPAVHAKVPRTYKITTAKEGYF